MVSVFDHLSYKTYLQEAIRALPKQGHGVRLRLAEHLGCQSTYISQVLQGDAHFSLELAEKAGKFFQLGQAELEYLLLLVQEERAGTRDLRAHFRRLRERLLESRKETKNRFLTPQPLSSEDQAKFYSAWHFAAIHALLTVPAYRTKDAIHERLGLPMPVVNDALDFFVRVGFATVDGGVYTPGTTRTHLPSGSPLLGKHHINWRLRSMLNIDHANADDLHYSSVHTVSEADYQKIREFLVKTLETARATIQASPEEKLCSLCVDYYEL
jgi:uncharacterized protein (TIGR02147 family)